MFTRLLSLFGLATAARLDSALAAVDAQRERLASLTEELARAEAVAADVPDLVRERDDAQLEAASLAWKLKQLEAARKPGPVNLDQDTVRKARELIANNAAIRADMLAAFGVILDDAMLGALNSAMDPALDPLAVKYHLGGGELCVRIKAELKAIVAAAKK